MAASGADVDCIRPGAPWDGVPSGEERDFAGLNTYVASPTSPSNAIVLITDIHGQQFKNLRLMADRFADEGFLVVAPDFFRGDPAPVGDNAKESLQDWFVRHDLPNQGTKDDLQKVITELRTTHEAKNIGVEGFCWGGWWTAWLAGKQSPQVEAAVVAHGSNLHQQLIENIATPTLFLHPELDQMMPPELLEHVKKLVGDGSSGCALEEFPGQKHGFAVRASPDDQGVMEASEKALLRSISFFKTHLG